MSRKDCNEKILSVPEMIKALPSERSIRNTKKVAEITELLPAIFQTLKVILNKLNEMTNQRDELEEKNQDLEKNIKVLQTQVCNTQYDTSCKNKVTINGLTAKKHETNKDTTAVFEKLLSDLDITDECEFLDVYRIPAKKIPNKPQLEPTLVVTFKGYKDRNLFFQSLKNLKELRQYKIFVNQVYPQMLLPKLKILQKQAKAHRLNNLKTSIHYDYENGDLCLYTKSGNLAWEKQ